MTLFAHIETGYALDVHDHPDEPSYAVWAKLIPGSSNWTISAVPAGTVHGAKSDRQGGWVNPETPAPTPTPKVLSKTAFQDYAVSQLGGVPAGMGRFTEIMDATRDSQNPAVRFAFARYEAALTFEKTNVAALTSIMASDTTQNHITTQERADILNNWPT